MMNKNAPAMPAISDNELEVMKILWRKNPCTSAEIIDALLPNSPWKSKTIQTMLNRLVQKGAVAAHKGPTRGYTYTPLIAENQYKRAASRHFLDKVYDGSLSLLLSGFIKDNSLSAAEIKALRTLLEEDNHE